MGIGVERATTTRGATSAACALILGLEWAGALAMWAAVPLAWLWVGGRIYSLTGSLGADVAVAFAGFVSTLFVVLALLRRLDAAWIALRRRAGYEQAEGALPQVVTISATLALGLFIGWYYLFSHAYVIPFMPSN